MTELAILLSLPVAFALSVPLFGVWLSEDD